MMAIPTAVSAESASCIINGVTGEVVEEENSDVMMPMASTTKIMTLLVALENANLDDVVTVCDEAIHEEGSSAYLKAGAKISMRDLLHGLMLNSGNDAAVATAYHISGGIEEFAELMNEKAEEIGALNTHFKNPDGLHDDEHFTTAYDLAIITQYAMKNKDFADIVSKKAYTGVMTLPDGSTEKVEYINHNKLLDELEGCIGVKTGFTKNAGRCLVSATKRGEGAYIAVTLNEPDDWKKHTKMHEDAFLTQKKRTLVNKGDTIKHLVGADSECSLVAAESFDVFVNKDWGHKFEIVTHLPKKIDFSLNKGEKVGYIEILSDGKTIGFADVEADRDFVFKKQARIKNCVMFTFMTVLRNIL